MTKKETVKILAIIAAAYPRFEVDELKVEVWHDMLGDLEYQTIQFAVKKCILGGTFPPSIHEVREAALLLLRPEAKTAGDAWSDVEKAVRNHGFYGWKEARRTFDPLTLRAVEAIDWQNICMSTKPGVERAHFIDIYDRMAQREQQEALLPEPLKQQIKQIRQHMPGLKAIEGGKK